MTRPLRLLVALGIVTGLATAATLGCVVGWWTEKREDDDGAAVDALDVVYRRPERGEEGL